MTAGGRSGKITYTRVYLTFLGGLKTQQRHKEVRQAHKLIRKPSKIVAT